MHPEPDHDAEAVQLGLERVLGLLPAEGLEPAPQLDVLLWHDLEREPSRRSELDVPHAKDGQERHDHWQEVDRL